MSATVEQRRRLEQLHARLADEVATLRSGEDWRRWLGAAARFHRYSFNNVLLILAQRPEATQVAGFRTWQALGRHVDRGQRGIQILAPIHRRRPGGSEDDGAEDGDASSAAASTGTATPARRLVGWRIAYVWDVSQTSGEPLPEQPRPTLLSGQAPPGLWEALAAEITGRGFIVRRGDCGDANGLTNFADRVVTVRLDVDEAQAVKTLAHELGHVLLHDPDRFAGARTASCRGVAEVEAESFAYLLATSTGLDTGDYTFGYVTSWATRVDSDSPQQIITDTGQRVLSAVTPVLERVLPPPAAHGPLSSEPAARVIAPSLAADTSLGEQPPRVTISTPPAADRARLLAANTTAAGFFRERLLDPDCAGPREYLGRRGLAHLLQHQTGWVLGYAPQGWRALTEHLRSRGFTDDELLAAGLGQTSRRGGLIDRFRDRLIVGLHDHDGRLVGFIGRARPDASEPTPKYLNTPATVLFDKSAVLCGLAEQRQRLTAGAVPVLVEGPLDVLAVAAAHQQEVGQHAATQASTAAGWAAAAPCGTALTATQATMLGGHPAGRVVVAFDADPPGVAAAARAYPLLAASSAQLHAATLPDGADPADLVAAPDGAHRLQQALARIRPLADQVIDAHLAPWRDRLDNAEARVAALRETAPAVAGLRPDDVGRQAARLAHLLQLDPGTVTAELIDAATAQLGDLNRPRLRRPVTAQLPETIPPAPPPLSPASHADAGRVLPGRRWSA